MVQVLPTVRPALQGGRVHQPVIQIAISHALQEPTPPDYKETVPTAPVAIIVQMQGGWGW